MRSAHCRKSAFTLVELLVVIGIIAVLISILLPSLARARQAANKVACASNMRQIGQMFMMYMTDNKGRLPLSRNWGGDWGSYVTGGVWPQAISPKGQPTNATPNWTRDDFDNYVSGAKAFTCPAQAADDDIQRTYVIMGRPNWISSNWAGEPDNSNMVWGYGMGTKTTPWITAPGVQIGKTASAETIMMGEMRVNGPEAIGSETVYQKWHMGGQYGQVDFNQLVNETLGVWAHELEGANYLFCDGHVEYQKCPVTYSPVVTAFDVWFKDSPGWPNCGTFALQFCVNKTVRDPNAWGMPLP